MLRRLWRLLRPARTAPEAADGLLRALHCGPDLLFPVAGAMP
jgi:hypothetical protein